MPTGGSLLAYADGTVWKTTDGSQWTEFEAPFVEGWVTALSDRFVWNFMTAGPAAGGFITDVMESADGETWTDAPVAPPPQTSLIRLETGWFATDGSMGASTAIRGGCWSATSGSRSSNST